MSTRPEHLVIAVDGTSGSGKSSTSRGVSRPDARAMLLEAFGAESIDRIEDESLTGPLRARLAAWLDARK